MAFDAVIIGAGVNSLAAAVHLASRGWSVGVFEQADAPGGAVKTAELTLPGFRHDRYAQNLNLFAGSPFYAMHGEALAKHGLSFVRADDCFASAFPDGRWFGVSSDLETNAARAAAFSAADEAGWRALTAEFGADAPLLFRMLGTPMTARALIAFGRAALMQKGTGWVFDTLRMTLSSSRAFLDARFQTPEIKAALAVWGMHLDFAPDIAGGALFPYLETMANQAFGMTLGAGGAGTIIDAMVARISELGGTVRTNAEVVDIRRVGGRAAAVRLASGEEIQARRAVIASVAPRALVERLLPGGSGDPRFDRRAREFRFGPGTMMIHLALSDLPDWTAGEELRRFAYVHLAPSLDAMARTYAEAMAGLLPAEPVLVVGQPTAIDPARAPHGRHILWVQLRALPTAIAGDAAGAITATDWPGAAEAMADRAIDIIERHAPGTRDRILGRFVETPADLERADPNLVGGDSGGGSHHLSQYFMLRPMPSWSRYRTPVRGLFLIGASTWPGAGTGAASGFLLARALAGPR